MIQHLYVHIPFCARICPYCAFYKAKVDRGQMMRFCQAVVAELEAMNHDLEIVPRTIFVGGGTPTALSTDQLEFLLTGLNQRLNLTAIEEFTIEANPGSVSSPKADLLRQLGVTRVSLGLQSWDNVLLELLGREHNAAQAEESFQILRRAGFKNINIDLMFGLPGQTASQWQSTLEKTISLNPDHISAYCLTYEEDTEFFLRHSRGELKSDADVDTDFFEMAMNRLESAGYEHYEISNYARPGFASAHNRAYWKGEDYLGLGPSAFSTIGLKRMQNVCDYTEYANRVLSQQSPIGSVETLTPEMKQVERLALGLRTGEGIPVDTLNRWPTETNEFTELGLLVRSNGSYKLTRAGKCVADEVAAAFV